MDAADLIGLGAGYDVRERSYTTTTSVSEACRADPRRVYLGLALVRATGVICVSTSPAVTVLTGVQLPTTGIIEWTWQRHGPLVGLAWYAVSDTLVEVLTVIEVILR